MEKCKKLWERQPRILNEEEYFVSSVLLPIVDCEEKPHILFEVRAGHLQRQPGEICFPGGKIEKNEFSRPQETAVRETVEELGVGREDIVLLGPLDYLATPNGTLIYPFAGYINSHANIAPNLDEVEEIFLVPVEHFLIHQPYRSKVEVATRYSYDFPYHKVPSTYKEGWYSGWSYSTFFYEYGERTIWGVTAKILYNFITLCWPENLGCVRDGE